jgi:hypothetical protein
MLLDSILFSEAFRLFNALIVGLGKVSMGWGVIADVFPKS